MDKKQVDFENLQKELHEWIEKISLLESRLNESGLSLKTNDSESIEILHPEIKLVEMRMAELRESVEEAHKQLKQGLLKAIKDLKKVYIKASARSRLKLDKNFA